MKKVGLLFFLFSFSIYVSAQLPYLEDFTGENGQGAVGPTPTTDVANVDWTVNVSAATLSASTDWFQVQDEVMEARDTDGEVIWESPNITVSGTSTINLSVDFSEDGNHESTDYAQAYYSLDGGAEVQFETNGDNRDDFTAVTAEHSLTLSGSNTSLKIIVKMKNNVGSEFLRFNNVSAKVLAPCAEPTDQSTALVLTEEATKISGSFTEAVSTPDNYIVVISTSSTLSAHPVDGVNYNIGDALGGGTIVTKTSISSFAAENLTQGTLYYFFVYSYNSQCTGSVDYNTTDPALTGSTTTITVPNIIITEIMLNPSTSSDALGEYFEIYNNSGADVDINGWIIRDNGSNNHTIDNGGALTIANGGLLVLGKNDDLNTNGGVTVDYVIGSSFTLTNTDDEIILENSIGLEVDRVEYDSGTGFPNPANASMYLTNINLDNNIGSNWAISTTSEGISPDKGSPGVSGETSLPVELISFKGEQRLEGIQLMWQTATEINNDYFIVQRSTNGHSFENIGEVIGFGNTNETQFYDFLDNNPNNGLNYYRLKQVDFDGKFEYSDIVTIEIEKQAIAIDVYPNPSTGRYNIKSSDKWTNQTTLEVFDMTGRLVYSKNIENNLFELNLEHLSNGSYFLKLTNQNDVFTTRIVKIQ